MSCKYKSFDNPCFCNVIHGECQFLNRPWDDRCPILAAYPDWDKYWLENQKSPVVLNGSIAMADVLAPDQKSSAVVDHLDFKTENEQ